MQTNRPTIPSPTSKETIIHYHYHYLPNTLTPTKTSPSHNNLERATSDRDLKLNLFGSNVTDSESTPSQRSWKKHVRPEFQSNVDPKDRIFKGSAREQARQILNQPYLVRVHAPASSGYTNKSSFLNLASNIKSSTKSGNNQAMLYRSNYFNNKKHSRIHFDDSSLNPEIRKTCITKDSEEVSSYPKLSLLTERQPCEQDNAYKFALLEEECTFLRSKFLEHYVRNHQIRHGKS